eukprot:TRINITY_DN659_c1_g1_i15.p1 TRINITY_DN659_c1_g1~~TRINITY_DN659_c1_g1_i15.p1  ORF type:complete len:248 (+),score=52.46 TRINITY_DN659_c1_g1_i15:90-746(+)
MEVTQSDDLQDIVLLPNNGQHDNAQFNDTGCDIIESEDEEMDQSVYSGKRVVKRKLPPGTSDYQASWYPRDWDDLTSDEEEEATKALSDMQEDEEENSVQEMGLLDMDNEDAMTTITYAESEMDVDLQKAKQEEKIKRAKEDEDFPDEMDTPKDIPARQRFQKYRNLQSMRTSKWNAKENLPKEYTQIFAFEDFRRTMKVAKFSPQTRSLSPLDKQVK